MFVMSWSVFPNGPFQTSIMFAGKSWSLPLSEAPERSLIGVGSGLTHKCYMVCGKYFVNLEIGPLS
jgi:hypothetical protein